MNDVDTTGANVLKHRRSPRDEVENLQLHTAGSTRGETRPLGTL